MEMSFLQTRRSNKVNYFPILQVLHGDLAARNILLADNGVVKVSDFGMSRKMYYESNYEKKGQVISLFVTYWYYNYENVGITGADARQVDGTRISYGSHFVI